MDECKDCVKLLKKQKKLKVEAKELFYEIAERGKELEKLRQIIDCCADLIPTEVYQKLDDIIYGYIERCTDVAKKKSKVELVKVA